MIFLKLMEPKGNAEFLDFDDFVFTRVPRKCSAASLTDLWSPLPGTQIFMDRNQGFDRFFCNYFLDLFLEF